MREYAENCLVMAISTDSLASQVLSMSLSIFSSLHQRKLKCYFVQTKGSRYFLMDFHFWTKGTGYFKKSNKNTKILIRIIKKSHKTLGVSSSIFVCDFYRIFSSGRGMQSHFGLMDFIFYSF
jgi:hypothetical protein